jgi:hypothetical protein
MYTTALQRPLAPPAPPGTYIVGLGLTLPLAPRLSVREAQPMSAALRWIALSFLAVACGPSGPLAGGPRGQPERAPPAREEPPRAAAPAPAPTPVASTPSRDEAPHELEMPAEESPIAQTCPAQAGDPPLLWDSQKNPPVIAFKYHQSGHDGGVTAWVGIYDDRSVCYRRVSTYFHPVFPFRPGSHVLDIKDDRFREGLVLGTLTAWRELSQEGRASAVVFHAYADPAEAKDAAAALRLSERRAAAASSWAVTKGLPRSAIKLEPHGWSLSARLSDDGDAEKLSRQVEMGFGEQPTMASAFTLGAPLSEPRRASLLRGIRGATPQGRGVAVGWSHHGPHCDVRLLRDVQGDAAGSPREPFVYTPALSEEICALFAAMVNDPCCRMPPGRLKPDADGRFSMWVTGRPFPADRRP